MARVVIPEQDLIWAAGFFDGEGCVGVQTNRAAYGVYYYPNVQIGQKLGRVLQWFKGYWGGSINVVTKYTATTSKKAPIVETPHTSCVWSIATAECRTFLNDIQPYVRCKKAQVDYVLSRPKLSLTEEEKKTLQRMKGIDSWPEL